MSELSRETDALLAEGRHGESLGASDKARLRRAVLSQVVAASVVVSTSTAAAWTSTAAKVVGALLVLGSAAGGVVVLAPHARPEQVATVRRVEPPRSLPRASVAPAAPLPVAQALTRPEPPIARAASIEAPAVAATSSRTPPASSLEEETRLLQLADDALKAGDALRSLHLLADHAARFPASVLAPERAAERVFAFCMAGRRDEAEDAARAFLAHDPVGPLAARVRASCAGPLGE